MQYDFIIFDLMKLGSKPTNVLCVKSSENLLLFMKSVQKN